MNSSSLERDLVSTKPGALQTLIQVADLFASSLNRVFNSPSDTHKDELAAHVLARFGAQHIRDRTEQAEGDMTVHISL